MVTLRGVLTEVFVAHHAIFIILCSHRISGDVSASGCPENALVDLKDVKFLPETVTWYTINGKGFQECPCSFKTCLSLCCPPGMARIQGGCVEDDVTNSSAPLPEVRIDLEDHAAEEGERSFNLFTNDPCDFGWMYPSVLENYHVMVNGSIYAPHYDEGSLSDFGHYCLFREPKSRVYLAKVCRPGTWAVWDMCCLFLAILVMLAVLVGYSIVPELRNLHGLIFRSYVATYIGTYVCSLGAQFTIESRNYAYLYNVSVFIGHFTAISCALWLNVMSFDIWWTFRGLRSIDGNTRKRNQKKFIWYAVYAWIIPVLLVTGCVAVMRYVPYFRNDTLGESFKQWSTVGLITAVFVCNTILYTATAITIRHHKRNTVNLANGVNKHHAINKQWFNLHVKLFMIMGGHMVIWALWLVWPTAPMTRLIVTLEVLQSLLIFLIFVWKDKVKKSLRNRLCGTTTVYPMIDSPKSNVWTTRSSESL